MLMLLLICPAIAAPTNPYEKIVLITYTFTNSGVHEVSTQIQYGIPPNPTIQNGDFEGLLLDSQHRTIDTFSIRDPRIQIGDTGNSAQSFNGLAAGNPQSVEFGIIIPYTPALRYVSLVDTSTGNTLVTTDLSPAISAFQNLYPLDPDMQSVQSAQESRSYSLVAEILLLSGIGIVVLASFLYFLRRPRSHTKKVLIVDDEPNIVDLLEIFLNKKGFETLSANDGISCLEILEERIPDLILLDIGLQTMDGWQTLSQIKKNPAYKSIPILMLTASPLTADKAKQYNICIEDYITKPFQLEELYTAIDKIFIRKQTFKKMADLAGKAGIEREKFCEFAKLTRRISVDKRIVNILYAPQLVPSQADLDSLDNMAIVDYLNNKTRSNEIRAEQLRQEIVAAFNAKGISGFSL